MPLKSSGKVYRVAGKELTLYPIGKLVEELKKAGYTRDAQTIRKWENSGVTPTALFRINGKRLYSMEQIECYVNIAKECDIRQGLSIVDTDFPARIWEELERVNSQYVSAAN